MHWQLGSAFDASALFLDSVTEVPRSVLKSNVILKEPIVGYGRRNIKSTDFFAVTVLSSLCHGLGRDCG